MNIKIEEHEMNIDGESSVLMTMARYTDEQGGVTVTQQKPSNEISLMLVGRPDLNSVIELLWAIKRHQESK